jgi:hypothetical protein
LKLLVRTGIQPLLQPFSITVKDVDLVESRLILSSSPKDEHFSVIPFLFSKEEEWVGPCFFESEEGAGPLDDIQGRAIAFSYCPQCHGEAPQPFSF